MIDLAPPPFLVDRPAIIRPSTKDILRHGGQPVLAMLPGMVPVIGAGRAPLVYSFLQYTEDEGNATTYTYSSQSFGAAAANRYLVAVFLGDNNGGNGTMSSVTIGGVAATKLVESVANQSVSIWIAAVPTGASGTVSATWQGSMFNSGCALYQLTGLSSSTPVDTTTDTTTSSNTLSGSINVSAGGVVIFGAAANSQRTATWTNAGEDWDAPFSSDNASRSGASQLYASAQTGLAVSCLWSGSSSQNAFAGVSLF